MTHLGLFEGIGGFSLAAKWMNWHTVAWCEIDNFCQKVLAYHFPEAEPLGDIKQTDFKKYYGKIDIITGGFPCQPFSLAGSRKGTVDHRFLWGEMLRAATEVSPAWVVAENVRGLLSIERGHTFEQVCLDLESAGYEVLPFVIPAAGLNAPHKRERLWIIAHRANAGAESLREWEKQVFEDRLATHANGIRSHSGGTICNREEKTTQDRTSIFFESGRFGKVEPATNAESTGQQTRPKRQGKEQFRRTDERTKLLPNWQNFPTQPPVCSRDDGLSAQLDGITFPAWRRESIKAYGNAIVPQVALEIFKCIEVIEKQ